MFIVVGALSFASPLVASPGKLWPRILKGGEREVVHETPGNVHQKQRSNSLARVGTS